MKLDSLLSRLGLAAVIAFSAGLALDFAPGTLFAVAATALFLLIIAHDYRPRRRFASCVATVSGRRERMPLAA